NTGLNKFDGYNFINFRNQTEDPKSFPGGVVLDIKENSNGDILLGLGIGFSIYSYENDNFLNVELPDSLPRFEFVRDIYIENEQNYWLSSINGIYNLRNKGTQTYDFEYFYYPKQNFSNEFSRVTAIQPKDEHNLWLGSDEGLF